MRLVFGLESFGGPAGRWLLARWVAASVAVPIFAGLLSASCPAAALQWQSIHDPGVGGWVTSVKVSPHDPQRVLAGGDLLGIALSTDGGATWRDTFGLKGGYEVEEFTWHPTQSDVVWAATMSGPYVSTNGGLNWLKKRTGFPAHVWGYHTAPVQKILFDPGNPSRLLAFTGNHRGFGNASGIGSRTELGRVFESIDAGNTWTSLALIGSGSEVMTAVWKPGSADILFAATADGLYSSQDRGASWTPTTNGLPSGKAWWVTVSPAAADSVWVAMGGSGVFKSADGGNTFVPANNGLPVNRGDSYAVIAASPSDATILYVANPDLPDRHLYRSVNGGASWSVVSSFGSTAYPFYQDFHCLDIDPADPRRVFAGTATTIWRALDGASFADVTSTRLASGIYRGTGWSGQVAVEFRFNPWNPSECALCALDSGKWVSRDNFSTWSFGGAGRGKGMDDWFAWQDFAFTRTPGAWWAAQGQFGGGGRIYRTTNGGTNWTATANPPGVDPAASQPANLVAHPGDPKKVWVLWSGKLFLTVNNGAAWTQVATNAGGLRVLEADLRTVPEPTLYLGGDHGVFKSTNGVDFAQIPGNSSGNPKRVSRLRIDPQKPDRLYCLNPAWSDQNTWDTGLWRCDGTNWTKLSMEGPGPVRHMHDVDVDPSDNLRLLLATDEDPFYNNTGETGIWLSEDGGATWQQENAGLPCWRTSVVRFRPDASGQVVVGLNGRGYYRAQMPPPPQRLIRPGSAWRYNDWGTNLGSAWRMPGYDDSAWPSGAAMLGFGDANGQSPITTNINRQQITLYFRHTFDVTNASLFTNLTARLLRDDGAVVYLNGAEAWRDNLPPGTITWQTLATNTVNGADESRWLSNPFNAALLVEGLNTLAVEVHQVTNTSSDIAFDFELTGRAAAVPDGPPVLNVVRAGADIVLDWPAAAGGFRLESAASLPSSHAWSPWAGPFVTNAGRILAPVPPTNSQRLFRLKWP